MTSHLFVALLPDQLPRNSTPDVALVIDTLRFTSTACAALAVGARSVSVVHDIERARKERARRIHSTLLCGERSCVRIPGFDLGNSPSEYTPQAVAGRDLVFSTTNGTVAVEASLGSMQVLLACLLNRRAVSAWLNAFARRSPVQLASPALPTSAWFVCAGTDGQIALEDVITAGAIIDATLQDAPLWQLGNDAAIIAHHLWQSAQSEQTPSQASIVGLLRKSRGGRNLIESGFEKDLSLVALLDSLETVPSLDRTIDPELAFNVPRFSLDKPPLA